MESNSLPLQAPDSIPSTAELLRKVRLLYVSEFRRWFAVTAPSSVIAAFVYLMAEQQAQAILRTIRGNIFQLYFREIAEATLFRVSSYFLCWLLGCFALGAIATAVSDLDGKDGDEWLRDSHQRPREHFGRVLVVALITLIAFAFGMAMLGIVDLAIMKVVGWAHFLRFTALAGLVGTVVVGSIVSWLGMAIPFVLRGNVGVWSALKKSLEAADGRQGFLLLLVVELLVSSYMAWYAAHYGLHLLLPASLRYSEWYPWISLIVFALASAAVQPILFIGFAVLADESSRTSAVNSG